MHSHLLVSDLPRSLPSLPRSPAPPCLPCVEGLQRAAPHSSEFPPTTAPLQTLHMDFYHPRSRRVFSSQDVNFDEPVCYYRLHPHASHPVPLAPLFLVPVSPPVDPLPPQGPAPSGVSQVDLPPLVEPSEVSSDSSGPAEGGDPAADNTAATRRSPRLETPLGFPPRPTSPPSQPAAVDSGAETAGAESGGAEPEGEGSGVAGSRGATTRGAGSGGATRGGAGSWGAATGGADSGGPASPSGGGVMGDLLEVLELDSHRSVTYLRCSRRWRFVRGSFGEAVPVVEGTVLLVLKLLVLE
ncbi:unnamed protein product, partial [Closterium sp. NIES-53]